MKKSELRQIIKEEIANITTQTSDFPDFPYLFKNRYPNSKAIKIDLSSDPEISKKKDIKPIFVVVKHIKDNNKYYQVYYQPSDTTNANYWISGHQGKEALQQQLLKKIINIAKSKI